MTAINLPAERAEAIYDESHHDVGLLLARISATLTDATTVLPGQGWIVSTLWNDGTIDDAPVVGWRSEGRTLEPLTMLPEMDYADVISDVEEPHIVWHPHHRDRDSVHAVLVAPKGSTP